MDEEKKRKSDMGALFIPAGLFIGMGLGWLLNNFIAWMFIGFGAGFLGYVITLLVRNKK